jgi:hypothetical protein
MPKGSKVLTIQWQLDRIILFAGVDTAAPMGKKEIRIYGTGIEINPAIIEKLVYIGSVVEPIRKFAWHVFSV